MNYTAEFKEYIDICKKQNQFIGFGNPNAPILIICNDIKTGLLSINENWYYKNSEYWESNIKNNKTLSQLGYDFIPSDDSPLNNNKHNWRKYQIFHNLIFNAASRIKDTDCQYPRKPSYKKYIPNRIDFLERIFIIEFKNMKVMDVILNTTFVKSFKITLLDDIDIKLREFKKYFRLLVMR